MNHSSFFLVVAVGLSSLSFMARAAQPMSPTNGSSANSIVQGLGSAVSAQVLAKHRGGHFFQIGEAQLSAQLQGNQASNNVTGMNIVTQQAFYGASGIPTIVQNSGNNVIIQNATILNVQMQ